MYSTSFKVHPAQEFYQPVPYPVAVQHSMDVLNYPQKTIYPMNYFGTGSSVPGYRGANILSIDLVYNQTMAKVERTFNQNIFSGL